MRQFFFKILFVFFTMIACLLWLQGCEKKYDNVINTTGSAPIISNAILTNSTVNTDTINIGATRKPDDLLTIRIPAFVSVIQGNRTDAIEAVSYSVASTSSSLSLAEGMLQNLGVQPDSSASDNIYSGFVEFQIQRVIIDKLSVTFLSESQLGYYSNVFILPLQIVRLNHPPVLSNLITDSLISLGGEDHVLQLSIAAIDSDGQSDILKVFFNSFKPNGSPASGNPFQMFDDGNTSGISGDRVANDGIYGLQISLPSTTTTGTYRFEFHAIDKSLDSSNVLIQTITITL